MVKMVQQTLADYINEVLHSEYINEAQDFNDNMLLNIDCLQDANTVTQNNTLPQLNMLQSNNA